ncbi:EsaB/YukD family protein [Paenibacillus sp. FSL H8-0280]|uniref:EsaB/YukD family protein n=1 Tax=Paenibacillus sp. FSL H8-0280 TaxID=2921382 RepID=UPI0032504A2F
MDRTLLTLIIDATGKKTDIELPNTIPLHELLEPMLKGLNEGMALTFQASNYRYYLSSDGSEWNSMDLQQSLEDVKAMDGSYLRIEQVSSFSTI